MNFVITQVDFVSVWIEVNWPRTAVLAAMLAAVLIALALFLARERKTRSDEADPLA